MMLKVIRGVATLLGAVVAILTFSGCAPQPAARQPVAPARENAVIHGAVYAAMAMKLALSCADQAKQSGNSEAPFRDTPVDPVFKLASESAEGRVYLEPKTETLFFVGDRSCGIEVPSVELTAFESVVPDLFERLEVAFTGPVLDETGRQIWLSKPKGGYSYSIAVRRPVELQVKGARASEGSRITFLRYYRNASGG